MEQLRAISFCSRPRSYRKRNTSLILGMDKAFWDIRFLLLPRDENPPSVIQPAFYSNSESSIQKRQYQPRFQPASFIAGSDYSHPRNPYSHTPEYALGVKHHTALSTGFVQNRMNLVQQSVLRKRLLKQNHIRRHGNLPCKLIATVSRGKYDLQTRSGRLQSF
jgi:hypothetical protein